MWVVHISEGEKLHIVHLWRVHIIITALNTKITLRQICPALRTKCTQKVCECSNLWLTLNIPTFSNSWTANEAPLGNRLKCIYFLSFCLIADYLFRWWNIKSRPPPSWRSPTLLLPSAPTNKSRPEKHFCPQNCSNPDGAHNSVTYHTAGSQLCDNFDLKGIFWAQ